MRNRDAWLELEALLADQFTGQVVLNCKQGKVLEYEVRYKARPTAGDSIDLMEVAERRIGS